MTRCIRLAVISGVLLLAASAAFADDADISFGGSPRMMAGHKTVSMQSEVVTMDVGDEHIDVDCRFVFKNDGPACDVRMGFPDRGRGGADPQEREEGKPLTSTFSSFESYVDGRRVPTSLVQDANNKSDLWHVKMVHFGAGQTLKVRDVYSTEVGSQIDVAHGTTTNTFQAIYVLHTGSSWKGNIGRAQVIVHLHRAKIDAPLKLVSSRAIGDPPASEIYWPSYNKGAIIYRGPSKPTVDGTTLRFVRSNFKPAYLDDVVLYFNQ